MTKNQIIDTIYRDSDYQDIFKNIANKKQHLLDDLKQEIFLALAQKNDQLIIDLYEAGKLKYYLIRMVMNQFNSNSSSFYSKYRATELKYESAKSVDEVVIHENTEAVKTFDIYNYVVENKILTWDQLEMFKLYYRIFPSTWEKDISATTSYRKIADKMGISWSNVGWQINLIKLKIYIAILNDSRLDKKLINRDHIIDFIQLHQNKIKN